MNDMNWYLRTQDETFGPETKAKLIEWARLGRIQPGQEISDDNVIWRRVEEVPFLDMRYSIDIGDGNPRGPFNRAAADALIASGRLPKTATVVETRPPFEEEQKADPETAGQESVSDSTATVVEKVVEKIVEKPVEVIKEVKVEVPVEKIVEKIVEKEVVKTVVDDTRVKELEALLEEERRHSASLQEKIDTASKTAADLRQTTAALQNEVNSAKDAVAAKERELEAASAKFEKVSKDASDQELKLREQIKALEDELRRLPQAASEVADIQAAVYSIMTKEAEELRSMLEAEKAEADAFRQRHQERADRLLERRRDLLKRAGANIEDMTRKALIERPEDPRTALLRKELEDLRRLDERKTLESERKIRELERSLAENTAASKRFVASQMDLTQLQNENQELRSRLQAREKELTQERERCEAMRQREAASQQAMVARLASLESPSIGTTASIATNQSREAKLVKLPSWMRLRK